MSDLKNEGKRSLQTLIDCGLTPKQASPAEFELICAKCKQVLRGTYTENLIVNSEFVDVACDDCGTKHRMLVQSNSGIIGFSLDSVELPPAKVKDNEIRIKVPWETLKNMSKKHIIENCKHENMDYRKFRSQKWICLNCGKEFKHHPHTLNGQCEQLGESWKKLVAEFSKECNKIISKLKLK